MRPSDARKLAKQVKGIDGWLSAEATGLFALVDAAQRSLGASGDLFEIGVHHGKSTVVLCAMARPSDSVAVCDLFGDQGNNTSCSGAGDRAIFECNLAALAPPGAVAAVFDKPSTRLSAAELNGPYRFFHVDGGHLFEEALSDLQIAADVLSTGGAIAVDDPFRPEWPGVTEAILTFLREQDALVPVTVAFNKLIIVPRDWHQPYERFLLENIWSYASRWVYRRKVLPLAGTPTHIFFIPSRFQSLGAQRMIARLKRTAVAARRRLP